MKLRSFDYLAKLITGVKFANGIDTTEKDRAAV